MVKIIITHTLDKHSGDANIKVQGKTFGDIWYSALVTAEDYNIDLLQKQLSRQKKGFNYYFYQSYLRKRNSNLIGQ